MKGCKCRFLSAAMLPTALFVSVAFLPTHAHSQANFYEGKTITLIAFTAPGGSGDLRVKRRFLF
jgi:tripartite-type tricarboxylate transporter receptor subunit TctC